MNTIQTLYESGKITDDEMDKLSAIRADFVQALDGGPTEVMSFIHNTFGECTHEELDKVADMVEVMRDEMMSTYDDPHEFVMSSLACDVALEKCAAGPIDAAGKLLGKGRFGAAARGALSAAVVGTVGLHLLNTIAQGVRTIKHPFQEAADRIMTDRMSENVLSSILMQNPTLKADKKTYENFHVLKKYAPQTVAVNKPLAESMLLKMQQWGHIDPQALSQMIKMEKDHIGNIQAKSLIPETEPTSMKVGPDLLGAMI